MIIPLTKTSIEILDTYIDNFNTKGYYLLHTIYNTDSLDYEGEVIIYNITKSINKIPRSLFSLDIFERDINIFKKYVNE